jgi:hypothetical protein
MVAGVFVQCPSNYRVYNNTCKCVPGYMLQGDLSTCADCAAGKYSNATDSTVCVDCPENTFSTGASPVCNDCPAYAVSVPGSVSVDTCSCVPGYPPSVTLGTRVCLPCTVAASRAWWVTTTTRRPGPDSRSRLHPAGKKRAVQRTAEPGKRSLH